MLCQDTGGRVRSGASLVGHVGEEIQLHRQRHGLHATADAEPSIQRRDVGPDAAFRDPQLCRDLPGAQTVRHLLQHDPLASRQSRPDRRRLPGSVGHGLELSGGPQLLLLRERSLTSSDGSNSFGDLCRRGALVQEPVDPQAESLEEVLFLLPAGEHEDSRGRAHGPKPSGELEAVQPGDAQVEDDDVRVDAGSLLDRTVALTDLADDLSSSQLGTGHPDKVPDQGVVFDDEDSGEGGGHVPLKCSIPMAGTPLEARSRLSWEESVAVSHVFVVDGHAVVLEAVQVLCAEQSGLDFAGGASTVPEATRLLDEAPADVLLIDMELPASLELVRTARDRWPRTAVLAMHDATAPERLQQAMSMGAVGVVEKSAEISELIGAIRRAATGGPRTHGAAAASAGAEEKDVPLSPRERAVLRLLAAGRSNQEIAAELGISPRTVASHVASIYRRLQVETRIEAVTAAIRLGISPEAAADT